MLLPLQANEPQHIKVAKSFLGIFEKTGHNDGDSIEILQRYVGIRKGKDPYCAAFVSYCIGKANVKYPKIKAGLAVKFITKKSINARDVYKGKIKVSQYAIVIWRHGSTIKGHTGFVLSWNRGSGTTIEANTSSGNKGSQDNGDGFYMRERSINPYSYFKIVAFTPVEYNNVN